MNGRTVREIFEHALALERAERERYLDGLGVSEETLKEVRALLELDAELPADPDSNDRGSSERSYPWPGDTVGSYRLLAPIGAGGMGTVWRATSTSDASVRVAIKFPHRSEDAPTEESERDRRLDQERLILSAIRHPGIVGLVDAGTTRGGTRYLVTEEISGLPIDEFAKGQRLTAEQLLTLFLRLTEVVMVIHDIGVVHRDLKPANILVTDHLWPVVLDFGAARILPESSLSPLHRTQGSAPHTPSHASPEQTDGSPITLASDVFALGVILDRLLDGLIDSSSESVAKLRALSQRARQEDPEQRPESARALRTEVEKLTRSAPAKGIQRPVFAAGILLAVLASALITRQLGVAPAPETGTSEDWVLMPPGFLEALEEMPPSEVPVESAEEILALAEEHDSPSLRVAALVRFAREFQYSDLREWLEDESLLERGRSPHDALQQDGEDQLSPQHRLAFAELLIEGGYYARGSQVLESFNPQLLPEHELPTFRGLELVLRTQRGEPVELFSKAGTPLDDEVEAIEELGADAQFALLAVGQVQALWSEAEETPDFMKEEPGELEDREVFSIVSLHAHLVANDLSDPLDEDALIELEDHLIDRFEAEPTASWLRAWAATRSARAWSLIRSPIEPKTADLEAALDLAEAGRLMIGPLGAPTDALARLSLLESLLSSRLDDSSQRSAEAWERTIALATQSFGPKAPRTLQIKARPSLGIIHAKATADLQESLQAWVDAHGIPWWYLPKRN